MREPAYTAYSALDPFFDIVMALAKWPRCMPRFFASDR